MFQKGASHILDDISPPFFPMHDTKTSSTKTLNPILCDVQVDLLNKVEEHQK